MRATVCTILMLLSGRSGAAQGAVQWHLSARPSVSIGGGGAPYSEFLRVGGVLLQPGGDIVVLDSGTNAICIFDRTGRYLRTLGRTGAGLGELKTPRLIGHAGDTLFVADRGNRRIAELLTDGTVVKTIPLAAADLATGLTVVGRFSDGRWAVVGAGRPNPVGPQRIYRDTSSVGILAPDATGGAVWIGTFPSQTIFVYNPASAARGEVAAAVPAAPGWVAAVSGDEVLIGDTGAPVIGAYSSAGAILRLIEVPLERQPLTDARLALLRQRAVADNPSERARPYLTALYSRAVLGTTLPVFESMVPAAGGSLWVQPYSADPAEPVSWLVLDAGGKPQARVLVPGGFRITDVGPGYVAGVHTDAGGAETVRIYRLTPR